VYAELKLMGAGLQYIDVGGASASTTTAAARTSLVDELQRSMNTPATSSTRVASVCNLRDIPHPMIVSESGRAVAAYHTAVLIFDALGSSALDKFRVTGDRAEASLRR